MNGLDRLVSNYWHGRHRVVNFNKTVELDVKGVIFRNAAFGDRPNCAFIRCPGQVGAPCDKLSDAEVHLKLEDVRMIFAYKFDHSTLNI